MRKMFELRPHLGKSDCVLVVNKSRHSYELEVKEVKQKVLLNSLIKSMTN